MIIKLLKSKIHRATVTEADLHYTGSIGIDRALMNIVGLIDYEYVEVYNITNGERFTTYTIPAPEDGGDIIINGAAAHKAKPGDLVIICAYADMTEQEAKLHRPRIQLVDKNNRPLEQ